MKDNDEIDRLVAAYVDGTLNEEDRVSFEQQVRENPQVLSRAAEAVRFDVELADAVKPDHLELIQQRRTVIDRVTGKPVLVESTDRMGPLGSLDGPTPAAPHHPRWWLVVVPAAIAIGAGGWWLATRPSQSNAIVTPPQEPARWMEIPLKNPGFEIPDLGVKPTSSHELKEWQEKFTTPDATVATGLPGGAHGGRQVATLAPGGHIKQLLHDTSGAAVLFEPGTRVKISGWVTPSGPIEGKMDGLNIALHFVDDQLRQYVVTYRFVAIDGSGWRHFTVEMEIPTQESFEPSYVRGTAPSATVRGRPILLSITNATSNVPLKGTFSVDDLKAEVMTRHGDSSETR